MRGRSRTTCRLMKMNRVLSRDSAIPLNLSELRRAYLGRVIIALRVEGQITSVQTGTAATGS